MHLFDDFKDCVCVFVSLSYAILKAENRYINKIMYKEVNNKFPTELHNKEATKREWKKNKEQEIKSVTSLSSCTRQASTRGGRCLASGPVSQKQASVGVKVACFMGPETFLFFALDRLRYSLSSFGVFLLNFY